MDIDTFSPDFAGRNVDNVFHSCLLGTAGQEEKVLALAAQHGMEDFYAENIWILCGSVRGQSRMNCLIRATAFILR